MLDFDCSFAEPLICQEILHFNSGKKSSENLINYLDLMRPYRYNQKIKRAAFSGNLSNQ